MSSEVEETVKRIVAHKGVQSVVIVDKEGIPIRTFPATMEHTMAVSHAALLVPLITKTKKFIKELDSTNDMTHMRIRSVKSEMLVYPEKDYFIVVSQSSAACDP